MLFIISLAITIFVHIATYSGIIDYNHTVTIVRSLFVAYYTYRILTIYYEEGTLFCYTFFKLVLIVLFLFAFLPFFLTVLAFYISLLGDPLFNYTLLTDGNSSGESPQDGSGGTNGASNNEGSGGTDGGSDNESNSSHGGGSPPESNNSGGGNNSPGNSVHSPSGDQVGDDDVPDRSIPIETCSHENAVHRYEDTSTDSLNTAVCDLNIRYVPNVGEVRHHAFAPLSDVASTCDICHAIICSDCLQTL